MISVYDASGALLQANRAWQETLGWSLREAQTNDDFFDRVYPDPRTRSEVLEFLRRAEGQWVDFRPRTRDGRTIDVSWVRMELSDGSRIGFGVDITKRKRAETALAESQALFSKIFQACPVALGMWTSPDARILDVNPAWLDLFGYTREEVVGRTTAELDLVDDETRTASIDRLRDDGEIRDLEVRVRRKSGERLDLIVSSVPVEIPGYESAFVTAHLDVTERDRLLRSESAARAEAEAALEQLRALQAITDRALVHLSLDEQLCELLTRLRQALGADRAGLSLVDETEQVLYTRAVNGMPFEAVAGVRVPLGKGVTGRIAAEGRPLIVHDVSELDLVGVKNIPPPGALRPARSVAGAPLHVGDKVIGVVTVASEHPNRFTEDQLHLLLLVADRVAPVIEQSRLVERVRAGEERLKTLSRRLMMAQEEERRRLAVELHDELGQVLTAVKINLESMEARALPGGVMAQLKTTTECVDQAMQRVRDLALDLRPSVLDDLGLPAALRWYADRFARDRPVKVHVAIEAVPDLRPEVEIACFRVAQEALTNVARHARAQHVRLDLHLIAEGLELRVRDDGIGFDGPAARARATGGASMGLLGMEERVSLVGGEFALMTAAGNGTEVRARFPVTERGRGTA
jgi:PAS domain S-box-containing protein